MGAVTFPAASGGVTQKVQEFTGTGTFTVPSNCTSVEVFLVGGGGGSGGGYHTGTTGALHFGGGGGGGGVIKRTIAVTAGSSYTVTIGAGGAAGTHIAAGSVGSDTTFGSLATAYGGGGGSVMDNWNAIYYYGITRATGGGNFNHMTASGGGYGGGAGGGAGGNATLASFYGIGSFTTQAFRIPNQIYSSRANLKSGGFGGAAHNTQQAWSISGPAIEGYGGGGGGGWNYNSTETPNIAPTAQYTLGAGCNSGSTTSIVNGVAADANTGHGGGGGAMYLNGGSTYTFNGGAGGSGYARITYWS